MRSGRAPDNSILCTESERLGRHDSPAERGERVVAPTLIVQIRCRAPRGLRDQPVGEHPANAAVQPARLELNRSAGSLGDVEHDPVPVALAVGHGHEDQELDGLERKERIGGRRRWCPGHIGLVTICISTLDGRGWFGVAKDDLGAGRVARVRTTI